MNDKIFCPKCEKRISVNKKTEKPIGIMKDGIYFHTKCLREQESYRGKDDKYYEFEKWITRNEDGVRRLITEAENALNVRDRIWEAVERKYIKQLALMKALRLLWNEKGSKMTSKWKKGFIPSVIDQFKDKGYLSNKQWEFVDNLVNGDHYHDGGYENTSKILQEMSNGDLTLVDRLQIARKKKGFIDWYNGKNEIEE